MAMKKPIRITVDPIGSLGYVKYSEEKRTSWIPIYREPDGSVEECGSEDGHWGEPTPVMVEFDDRDEIVAIEILSIDAADLVSIARDYARDNDLEFPDDLRAAAARDPAA